MRRSETAAPDRKIVKSDNFEIERILHLKLEIRNFKLDDA
jgi:hypothetical protein